MVLAIQTRGGHRIHHRRKRRHVPHHGQRAVLRVKRQSKVVAENQIPNRRLLCSINPRVRNAFSNCCLHHTRVMGIEQNGTLCLVEVLRIFRCGCFRYPVGVVKQHTQVTQASDARLGTYRWLTNFKAWVAQRAFFCLARLMVEIHLLVRASRYAHAPAAAPILVHQHNAIFGSLVHCA